MGIHRRGSPPSGPPGEPADPADLAEVERQAVKLAAELEGWDTADQARLAERETRTRRRTRRLAHGLSRGGGRLTHGGRALADRLLGLAPRIPVRDLATLRRQHPEAATPDELADALVTGACRATAAIGAGIGAAAIVPTAALTAELAAELLAVAAVEVKLIAELHEVYGYPVTGRPVDRATAYVGAWAQRRGVDSISLLQPSGLLALGAGARVRTQVGRRMACGSLRKLPSLSPFLLGSALGAHLNRRDTRHLATLVRTDLRWRAGGLPGYWKAAVSS